MFRPTVLAVIIIATIALAKAQSTAPAYGQCGGQSWSGATLCPSGYSCSLVNQWYSQCIPGAAGTTSTTATSTGPNQGIPTGPSPTPTTPTTTYTPPVSTTTPTLIPQHSFIRTVTEPNYRKYLRSRVLGTPGDAVVGEHMQAALFRVEGGQLIQNVVGGAPLYAAVEAPADASAKKLKVSWQAAPGANGSFRWSGDTLEWSSPSVSRPQSNAWLVCPDSAGNKLAYINLGPYGYQTPAGCADHTIHAYTGPMAVP